MTRPHANRFSSMPWICSLMLPLLLGACSQDADDQVAVGTQQHQQDVIAIVDVTVLPMVGEDRLDHQTVMIQNGRVSFLGSAAEAVVPESATVIDGSGRFLLPALSDMHAHPMREADLALYLANGVTTIRAMWGEPSLLAMRDAVRAGDTPGPRIYSSGRIVGGAPPHHFGTVALAKPENAETVISSQIEDGFDFIKIYSLMSAEVFDAVDAAATTMGVEFSGHVPMEVSLERAVASHMQTMEHLYGFIKTLQKPELNADIEWRFMDAEAADLVSQWGSGELQLDDLFDEAGRKALIERVAADDVWIVPTFSVLRPHEFTRLPETARYLHPSIRGAWEMFIPMMSGQSPETLSGESKLFDYQLALVGDLYRAGGRLLVGTDAPNPGVVTGFAVAEEIALMERAGLSKVDALRAATLWPAQYMNEADSRGHVSVGAVADLILLDADPLRDLAALKGPDMVFRSYPDSSEPYTQVYNHEDLVALLDKVDAEWVALEAELAAEPELGDESLPRYSFSSEKGERLSLTVQSDEATLTITAALKASASADWQRFELGYGQQGGTLMVDGRAYTVAPESGALQLDGAVLAQADDASESALILTRSVADLPVLWSAMEGMEQGDQRSITAWLCPQILDCSDARYATLNVERLADSVTDGVFYYSGVQQFAVSADGQKLGTVSIGGGPFYGGQPFSLDVPGWPLANMDRPR